MGNYNSLCRQEECETKIRKFETDSFYCKYHRCVRINCNLPKHENSKYCKFHV